MYYYIMEPAGRKMELWQDKVKDILGDLGIAGETVVPTAARSIEELTSLGIVKGYTTIVAVGSEKLVNRVITAIMNQKNARDVVLGIIPENYNSLLAKYVEVSNLNEACDSLKYRKLKTIDLCSVEPNRYFITQAKIESQKTAYAYLTLDDIKAGLNFNKIVIKPGLDILIEDLSVKKPTIKFFGRLFGKKETDIYSSHFRSKTVKIETPDVSLSVEVDNDIISKTPISCQNRSKVLKLITKRDTIKSKE